MTFFLTIWNLQSPGMDLAMSILHLSGQNNHNVTNQWTHINLHKTYFNQMNRGWVQLYLRYDSINIKLQSKTRIKKIGTSISYIATIFLYTLNALPSS